MARIALLDASDGTATAVRAALGADAVAACRRGTVPSDAILLIAETRGAAATDAAGLGLPDSGAPLLLLVDHPVAVVSASFGVRRVATLQKPFDLIDLRQIVRQLLDPTSDSAPGKRGQVHFSDAPAAPWLGPPRNRGQVQVLGAPWLEPPRVAVEGAVTLTAASRLDGAVWIVGEAGTGTDHVAAALAVAWDPDREPIVWPESDSLASAVSRLGDAGRVLWVPALDERPLREQRAFERYLAVEPRRRVAVTSADDPAAAVAAGSLLRSLHHALSRVSLRLAPLRERRGDIAALAVSIAGGVASNAFGAERVVLTDEARRTLESYPWPGNLSELEAVVTRSVIACAGARGSQGGTRGSDDTRVMELGAGNLRFAPGHLAPMNPADSGEPPAQATAQSAQSADAAAPPRRAVVVALGDMAAARAARPSDSTSPEAVQDPGTASLASPTHPRHEGVEGVLAAFAHDIRNPMSTIKTFAGLQAASAGDDSAELARLAIEACERVDEHLEVLQRYAELVPSAPALVDIVETLGEAVDAGGGAASLAISARRSLWVRTDAALARFVADVIVAECRSRVRATGQAASDEVDAASADIAAPAADAAADTEGLEIRIPVGGAAVDRLDKWVEGTSLPWRLALAREAARRGGGDLQVDVEDGQMRLHWRLPRVEEGRNDDQAGSPDRRRRSRSS